MKKLFALFALVAGCACAQQSLSFTSTMTATGTSATAYTTNGVNGAILPILNHTVQVVTTGSPSGCTLRLEGSLDNTNWFDLSGTKDCSGTDPGTSTPGIMFHVDGKLVPYLRANLLTWTGGTNAVITYRGQN